MKEYPLDLENRVRVASFLYKLAIRTQRISRRVVDTGAVAKVFKEAFPGNTLHKFLAAFQIKPDSKIRSKQGPDLVHAIANRTLVPGEGSAVRLEMFFGPFQVYDNRDGELVVPTIKSERQHVDITNTVSLMSLEKGLMSVFSTAGGRFKVEVLSKDIRTEADREYDIVTDYGTISLSKTKSTQGQVFKVVDKNGQVVYYEDPKAIAVNAEDPYREAIFGTAEEALALWNDLTRGSKFKTHPLSGLPSRVVYLKHVGVYSEGSGNDVEAGIYHGLNGILDVSDAKEKSLEEARSREELIRWTSEDQEVA